eukprot:1317243-Ditylum_brightwellii.AAC.1
MCTGLPLLDQNSIWLVCLYRPVNQNCLVLHDSSVVSKHHGLGGFVILPLQWHRVIPIFEKAPVDILCHIIVPVSDLGLEELLSSSNKMSHSFILLMVEVA